MQPEPVNRRGIGNDTAHWQAVFAWVRDPIGVEWFSVRSHAVTALARSGLRKTSTPGSRTARHEEQER